MALKKWIKSWLSKRGYFLFWVREGEPTGVSFEIDLLRMMNIRDSVVFDIGANIGQTIDMILGKLPSAQIVAFEASSSVCNQLKASHASLCKQIHQVALADIDGVLEFTNYDNSVFSSLLKLNPSGMHQLPELKELRTEIVQVRRLDTMFPELGFSNIDLLKIDTQGNDLNVLRGAETLFSKGVVKRVLIELNFFQMYDNEGDGLAIMTFLKNHDFHLVEMYEKNRNGRVITWCTGLFEHNTIAIA